MHSKQCFSPPCARRLATSASIERAEHKRQCQANPKQETRAITQLGAEPSLEGTILSLTAGSRWGSTDYDRPLLAALQAALPPQPAAVPSQPTGQPSHPASTLSQPFGKPDLSSAALGGQWELVYTTEASVHAIVRRLPVAGIQQQVDLQSMRVTNRILFSWPPSSSLSASAPCSLPQPMRLRYKFDTLELQLWGRSLRVPFVVGGGWTQAHYCSPTMRVMNNSLGDTLVFVRSTHALQGQGVEGGEGVGNV
ncbi:hypothetical protein V8C86DRAFT_1612317 [Haematococcus lacustris]